MQQRKTYTWLWLATVPCVIFKSFSLKAECLNSGVWKVSSGSELPIFPTPSLYIYSGGTLFQSNFYDFCCWFCIGVSVMASCPQGKNLWLFWFCWNFKFLLILGLWTMHLKPAMFLKLESFLPRFVFNNKCLEFAYFKVEVVSYIMYFLSRNGSLIKNTGIKKGVSLPGKFLRLIFLLSSKKITLINYQCYSYF